MNQRTTGGCGRPALPASEAASRRGRWRHAMAFSGLSAPEAGRLVGRSVASVWSYGSATGCVPTERAIDLLEAHNLERAEAEIDRLKPQG